MLTRDTAAFIDGIEDADAVLIGKCMIRRSKSFRKLCIFAGHAHELPKETEVLRLWLKAYTLGELARHIDNCDEFEEEGKHRFLAAIECVALEFKDHADNFIRSLTDKDIRILARWVNKWDGFDSDVVQGATEDIREELRDCPLDSLKQVIDFGIEQKPENENLLALRGKYEEARTS